MKVPDRVYLGTELKALSFVDDIALLGKPRARDRRLFEPLIDTARRCDQEVNTDKAEFFSVSRNEGGGGSLLVRGLEFKNVARGWAIFQRQ